MATGATMEKIISQWQSILSVIKDEFYSDNQIRFDTWIIPVVPMNLDNGTLYIRIPEENAPIVNYYCKNFSSQFQVAIVETLGINYNIEFVAEKQTEISNDNSIEKESSENPLLSSHYTFDNFVVGSNNRMAHAAALAVADSPGEVYNPLLIYGGAGLGKTHLMHAIAYYIKEKNPNAVVRYVSSETFTNEVISAMRKSDINMNAMDILREKYRNVDTLLIDDIQFIIGKDRTQEEFFHTFNALHEAHKQIVITSDKPPKDMPTLEERIRTRLNWGVMADIGAPDYETRMAILQKKEESENFYVSDDILEYIANNITTNIRELEGALNKLSAYSRLSPDKKITLDVAIKELENIIYQDASNIITAEFIIDTVCDHFHITRDDMSSKKRNSEISHPRQIAMYLCRKMTDISLNEIGNYMGGRNHSTILHGVESIEEEVEKNEKTKNTIDILKKKIDPS